MDLAVIDGVVGSRKCLAQHLTTKHLRTTYIATFATKEIVFNALELQEMKQIVKDGVHRRMPSVARYSAVDDDPGPAHEY